MLRRRSLPGERLEMYSPIGLIPVDSFTGKSPLGRLRVFLEIRDELGQFRETDIKEVRTAGGVIAYPSLGRSAELDKPPRHYRVRVEAELYVPYYKGTTPGGTNDGIEFTTFPYNDAVPPKNYPKNAAGFPDYLKTVLRKVFLMPAPNYPFPDRVLVLRGVVKSILGEPIIGATVSWRATETAMTAGGTVRLPGTVASAHPAGEFGLPIRPTKPEHLTQKQEIDAVDPRTNKTAKIKVSIPSAVRRNQIITIS
jgi:hypothetical protein